uniref:Delta(14)-sterol reductase n=1 Tax=Arcella intermedia TaxID=1963864 RepID=A0A6B2LCB5_9EUKA
MIYERYGELVSFVLVFSFVVSVYLYISAYLFNRVEKHHITGNFFLDFWLGVELNPRFGGLDLKMFALRPGMIGWIMINLSTLTKQYATLGTVGLRMFLSFLLSFLYVADYFFFEEKMLSTWDIIAEHWGFMLVWADLWFIPITFSIQGWYLLELDDNISAPHIFLTLALFAVGYYIFRISNLEKDQFKNDPEKRIWGKKAKSIDNKLLVDGWWGKMQHPNYVGDILMAISFSLPAGYSYLGAYFYPIYLTTLLIHRQMRDDKKCANKYGTLWEKYTKQVPYKLIPGLY